MDHGILRKFIIEEMNVRWKIVPLNGRHLEYFSESTLDILYLFSLPFINVF